MRCCCAPSSAPLPGPEPPSSLPSWSDPGRWGISIARASSSGLLPKAESSSMSESEFSPEKNMLGGGGAMYFDCAWLGAPLSEVPSPEPWPCDDLHSVSQFCRCQTHIQRDCARDCVRGSGSRCTR